MMYSGRPEHKNVSLKKVVLQAVWLAAAGAGGVAAQIVPAPPESPVSQPASYVVGLSTNSSTGGHASWYDNSGQSIVLDQSIDANPLGFTFDPSGSYAETISSTGTMNFFSAAMYYPSPGSPHLDTKSLGHNLLPAATCTSNVFSSGAGLFAFDIKQSMLDAGLSSGGASGSFSLGPTLRVGSTPIAMTGASGASRYTVVSQNVPYGVACNNIAASVPSTGVATLVDLNGGGVTPSASLPLGHCPVYAVTSTDGYRSFVLNRGDDTVTVINVPAASVDTTINLDAGTPNATHKGPVHAEYVARTSKLVVANYDNDTVSIIDVGLYNQGTDAPSFGKTVTVDLWNKGTPPVVNGVSIVKHPAAITALPDGSLAYVANQSNGTVDVIDLRLGEVVKTITLTPLSPTGGFPAWKLDPGCPNVATPLLGGCIHPRDLAIIANSTTNSVNANVYVGSPDSPIFTYIDANSNVSFSFEQDYSKASGGNILSLAVDTQLAPAGTNNLFASRLPGAGQPCYLPNSAPTNLAACQSH